MSDQNPAETAVIGTAVDGRKNQGTIDPYDLPWKHQSPLFMTEVELSLNNSFRLMIVE